MFKFIFQVRSWETLRLFSINNKTINYVHLTQGYTMAIRPVSFHTSPHLQYKIVYITDAASTTLASQKLLILGQKCPTNGVTVVKVVLGRTRVRGVLTRLSELQLTFSLIGKNILRYLYWE